MYHIIGVMTGNSLDAVDVVLTAFDNDKMTDMAHSSLPYPKALRDDFIGVRRLIKGDEKTPPLSMEELKNLPLFRQAHDAYIRLVAHTINEMIEQNDLDRKTIDAIGFHGQTLDHYPPSVARDDKNVYTLQIGSGQMLAHLTGLPVIYDFRSDDIMAGGEGAPLAPTHNKNLATALGLNEAVFFNAGNTGNVSVISNDTVLGWDAGPFNDFPDKIVRHNTDDPCDVNGQYGLRGRVDMDGVRRLFETAAITADGQNFLNVVPPRSSDPSWYKLPADFLDPAHFADNVRTAEFFSAYMAAYTLRFVPDTIAMPCDFILFGGGWLNTVCKTAFEDILTGAAPVLTEHEHLFATIRARFKKVPTFQIIPSSAYMEARVIADLARFYLEGKPWFYHMADTPKHVVLGTKCTPVGGDVTAQALFEKGDFDFWPDAINRAAKGWQHRPLIKGD